MKAAFLVAILGGYALTASAQAPVIRAQLQPAKSILVGSAGALDRFGPGTQLFYRQPRIPRVRDGERRRGAAAESSTTYK